MQKWSKITFQGSSNIAYKHSNGSKYLFECTECFLLILSQSSVLHTWRSFVKRFSAQQQQWQCGSLGSISDGATAVCTAGAVSSGNRSMCTSDSLSPTSSLAQNSNLCLPGAESITSFLVLNDTIQMYCFLKHICSGSWIHECFFYKLLWYDATFAISCLYNLCL